MRHGGQLLIHQLKSLGCERVFSKPGQNTTYILDGLYENAAVQTITCRHESGAATMAEAHGQLTGKPGVCVVSGAHGAVNAASGVHIAWQNNSPMLLVVGLPSSEFAGRAISEDIDLHSLFGKIAKDVHVVWRTDQIPEIIMKAYQTSISDFPGPVVIGLREDILSDRSQAEALVPGRCFSAAPGPQDVETVLEILNRSSRPLLIAGGPGWTEITSQKLMEFAEKFCIPTVAAYDCQDYIDNTHSRYAGHLAPSLNAKLDRLVRDADLIISVGATLDEKTTSSFTTIQAPKAVQQIIQFSPSAAEFGKTHQADLFVQSSSENAALALSELEAPKSLQWEEWANQAKAQQDRHIVAEDTPGDVKLEYIVRVLNEILPDDAILTYGDGAYTSWLHRYRLYTRPNSRLSPHCEAAEYGLPAAIAAKLQDPERTVVCITGDGGFMMSASELATAALYGLKIVVIVVNNRMYGAVRKRQEQKFPGRVLGASVSNPDILKFAESFGAEAEAIDHRKAFRSVLKRCLKGKTPSVIELRVDENAISPNQSLSDFSN